jgi:hypothetical protein
LGPGLPDVAFSHPKFQFGNILEVTWIEKFWYVSGSFDIIYQFTASWYSLRPLGNFKAVSNIFPKFGIFYQVKSGNPARVPKNLLPGHPES